MIIFIVIYCIAKNRIKPQRAAGISNPTRQEESFEREIKGTVQYIEVLPPNNTAHSPTNSTCLPDQPTVTTFINDVDKPSILSQTQCNDEIYYENVGQEDDNKKTVPSYVNVGMRPSRAKTTIESKNIRKMNYNGARPPPPTSKKPNIKKSRSATASAIMVTLPIYEEPNSTATDVRMSCVPPIPSTVSNGTTDGTTDSASNGVTDGTTDGTSNGTTDGTTNGTSNGTSNGTTDGASNGTTDGASDLIDVKWNKAYHKFDISFIQAIN